MVSWTSFEIKECDHCYSSVELSEEERPVKNIQNSRRGFNKGKTQTISTWTYETCCETIKKMQKCIFEIHRVIFCARIERWVALKCRLVFFSLWNERSNFQHLSMPWGIIFILQFAVLDQNDFTFLAANFFLQASELICSFIIFVLYMRKPCMTCHRLMVNISSKYTLRLPLFSIYFTTTEVFLRAKPKWDNIWAQLYL